MLECEKCLCDEYNENFYNDGECEICFRCDDAPKHVCPEKKYRDDHGDVQCD